MTTGGNRNALNREVGVDGERDWSRGLLGCCSDMCCVCTSILYFLGCWLSRFPSQGVVPFCALAWSFPKLSSASYICGVEALLSQVEDQHVVPIVGFMVACIVVCAAISVYWHVSCRYVKLAASHKWARLTRCPDRKPREYPHTLQHTWGHHRRLL